MKNSFKTLFLFLSFLLSYSVYGQNNSNEGISSLSWMIGKWSVSATEEASDNASFKETGFQECSWVLNKRAIRCENYIRRIESSGRYAKSSQTRSYIYYMTYDKKGKHFVQTWIRSSGPNTHDFRTKEDGSLYGEWSFIHPSLGYKMLINSTIFKMDENHFRVLELLKNEEGTFDEKYEGIATRIE